MADPPTPETRDVAPVPRLLLTPAQAAEALALGRRKLWELTALGDGGDPAGLRCVRIGRAVRYAPGDLREWIDRQRTRA